MSSHLWLLEQFLEWGWIVCMIAWFAICSWLDLRKGPRRG